MRIPEELPAARAHVRAAGVLTPSECAVVAVGAKLAVFELSPNSLQSNLCKIEVSDTLNPRLESTPVQGLAFIIDY